MESPDSQAGQPEECPNCGSLNRVPVPKPTIQPRPNDPPHHVSPQRGPASGRKPLLVGAIVTGVIVVAVGGYLAMRQESPKETTHKAVQEPGPAQKQNESELARLRTENAQLKAKIANVEVTKPSVPIISSPDPNTMPDISQFKVFAANFAKIMEARGKRIFKDSSLTYTYTFHLNSCDYKKSDSVLYPIVAVAMFDNLTMAESNNNETVFFNSLRECYTVYFAFQNGKWMPIKAFYKTVSHDQVPKQAPDTNLGIEMDVSPDLLADMKQIAEEL
ncbi:MAG: hypothetical protein JXA11_15735 [Phycisphaerae bacterium]|nr:hypothetical protein [Phycisphaerae bacterium]